MSAAALVECPLCLHRFDAGESSACASCPIGAGCSLACCPSCGYGAPDPARSTLLRLARALRRSPAAPARSLARAAPGSRVTIERVPGDHVEHLLAYGIAPGRRVDVLQTTPATIVRIEHTELALEPEIGRAIEVSQ